MRVPLRLLIAALTLSAAFAPPIEAQKRGTTRMISAHNGYTLEVAANGDVQFTDDDQGIRSLSPGGWFSIEERGRGVADRRVEFRARGGEVERAYWTSGRPAEWDANAAMWLRDLLPQVIRESGIGARDRVARIVKGEGVAGVLREIDRIESDGAKSTYYRVLVEEHRLSSAELARVIRSAGDQIGSDGDLAHLLSAIAEQPSVDQDGVRGAFFAAVDAIGSDGDRHHVLSRLLRKGNLSEPMLLGLLGSASRIGSDGDRAALLTRLIRSEPLESARARQAFFAAVDRIGSDGDRAMVLTRTLNQHPTRAEMVVDVLRSARQIGSDGDKTMVLLRVPRALLQREPIANAYMDTMRTIGSDGDRARAATHLLESRY